VDPEAGTIEVAFTATEQFLNPVGVIQGGLLASADARWFRYLAAVQG